MMIHCDKASELISKKIDRNLSFMEKISLKIHTLICSTCALFENEARTISNSINTHSKSDIKLSAEAKKRMEEALISKNNT